MTKKKVKYKIVLKNNFLDGINFWEQELLPDIAMPPCLAVRGPTYTSSINVPLSSQLLRESLKLLTLSMMQRKAYETTGDAPGLTCEREREINVH